VMGLGLDARAAISPVHADGMTMGIGPMPVSHNHKDTRAAWPRGSAYAWGSMTVLQHHGGTHDALYWGSALMSEM
jgi:hypothetical protein